uniref:Arrestin C-terminal-like domain-containing protein n=1 Tax=Knipowitschia caucasica TaxID=637954 RepID=A0AAV2JTV6_KNICA
MRIPKKDTTKLNYVTQDTMDNNPELRVPQHETKDKKLKLLNSGTVSMDVDIDKVGYYQGESIQVFATIQNNSSRDIRPKFCLYSKQSFFARRLLTKDLVKEVQQKVTQGPSVAPPPAASDFGVGAYGNAQPPIYCPMPYALRPTRTTIYPSTARGHDSSFSSSILSSTEGDTMTIQNFSIEYDAINSKNIFSTGDKIKGRIVLEVSKKIQVQALIFRAQGQAKVCWSEQRGQYVHMVYMSKEKYYNVEQHILPTRPHGTDVIGPGKHVFPFSFKITESNLPSTFKSSVGKIVHKLKAELKQSMKMTKTAKTHITFVSPADMNIPGLLEPQHGSKDKTISAFGSGTVAMDVNIERLGYWQGEALKVTVEIQNQSSRMVKPKLIFYKAKSHFAQGRRRMTTSNILKEKCDPVESGCSKTVRKTITIPQELPCSILNCSIIRLEYRLKAGVPAQGKTLSIIRLEYRLKAGVPAQGKTLSIIRLEYRLKAGVPAQGKTLSIIRLEYRLKAGVPAQGKTLSIIRLEYRLKIRLDIKFAINPEIELPIVVLPEKSSHMAPSNKSKEDETLAQPTSGTASSLSQAPAGRAQAPAGRAPAPAGRAPAPAGRAPAPSGRAQAPAGRAGRAQAPAGRAQAPVRYPPAAASASDDPPPHGADALYPSYSHVDRHSLL